MSTTGVDIDSIADYRTEYQSYIKKPKISGHNLTGLCPFHDDRNSSFSADIQTGLWYCHAEDIGGNFIEFYARIHGVDTKEAYKQILRKYGISQKAGNKANKRSYTLAQYAAEKHLPEEWLSAECGLCTQEDDDGTQYLAEPYRDETGCETVLRKRYAYKELKWRQGSAGKIGLYGEWKLPEIRKARSVILVEGESDTQSLWFMGLPAIGVPGAAKFKPKFSELLQGLKLYIHQENDQGGDVFLQKTLKSLREGGFIGKVYRFSCSTIGLKDPSEVLIRFGKEDSAKKILSLAQRAERLDLPERGEIPDAIPGAPIKLYQPDGWFFSDKGVCCIDGKSHEPVLVCRTPIIITQRLKSLDTGDEKIEAAFKRDGEWWKGIYPRSTIFTNRGITALADSGCTVTSENARAVVRFLAALEAENIDIIPKSDSTSTFGWQSGRRFIPGCEQDIILDIDPSQRAMALAYTQNGEFTGWIKTMKPHRERDKFRFILAGAFAAPLLRIIKGRILIIYNWGGSKGGKTAALKASLSTWGDPDRLMVNFNATQVGLERTAALYCDLPLGIDERQLAGRNQESLEKIIYMIASGTGRIRGAKAGGIQSISSWRTVALATGEEPLSTETSQTGVSTRVLEIYGGPFENERDASLMHQEAPLNCGWAGPEFVKRIVNLSEESICESFRKMRDYVHSVSNGRSGAHADGVAAVALADAMIDTWFFGGEVVGFDPELKELVIPESSWDRAKAMAQNILQEQMSADAGDVNENAAQFITDWIMSNKAYFGQDIYGKCFGFLSVNKDAAYIFPSVLNDALSKAGYSPRKTLKYLADRGQIASPPRKDNNGKNYSVVKRYEGKTTRFVEFFFEDPDGKTDNTGTCGTELTTLAELLVHQKSHTEDDDGFMAVPDDIDLPFD